MLLLGWAAHQTAQEPPPNLPLVPDCSAERGAAQQLPVPGAERLGHVPSGHDVRHVLRMQRRPLDVHAWREESRGRGQKTRGFQPAWGGPTRSMQEPANTVAPTVGGHSNNTVRGKLLEPPIPGVDEQQRRTRRHTVACGGQARPEPPVAVREQDVQPCGAPNEVRAGSAHRWALGSEQPLSSVRPSAGATHRWRVIAHMQRICLKH